MKKLIAAVAAFTVLGGSAALAQSYGYAAPPSYAQPYYGQAPAYGGYGYAPPSGYGYGYGYAPPYAESYHYDAPPRYVVHRAPTYRHGPSHHEYQRRDHRPQRDRHHDGRRRGNGRHH